MFELNGKVIPNAAVTQIPSPNSLPSSLPRVLYAAFFYHKDGQALPVNIRAV
jgi:hypothetical protein